MKYETWKIPCKRSIDWRFLQIEKVKRNATNYKGKHATAFKVLNMCWYDYFCALYILSYCNWSSYRAIERSMRMSYNISTRIDGERMLLTIEMHSCDFSSTVEQIFNYNKENLEKNFK